ncbi:tRNA pseudouridine(38-40) synthase TruA [Solicola sp. PLA-1-18]|uniref:tRNA pseudouridine(38-40) synthase TruA n=1 Tax=Solicola sp. PLA-1-18 TaxID=3380532 RepID=UPI003B7F970A
MRWRLDVSYDGAGFHGWATQPGLRTVQETIEDALAMVLRLPEPARLTCAGRTDTGVHARGQVVHVDLDALDEQPEPERLLRRLARVLPPDVRVRAVRHAAPGFDARFSALRRRYAYRICDTTAGPDPLVRAHVVDHRRPLDVDAMDAAGAHLLGEHDFASFCKRREGATTVRRLLRLSTVRRPDDVLETTVVADAFCHSMVRSLMGALVAVGEGRFEPAWAAEVLAGRTRAPQVTVMPAHGLTLEEVVYPSDADLASRAHETRRRRDEPPA